MAYAISVVSLPVQDGAISWPFRLQLADKTASVINPSVDLGFAAFWMVAVKLSVKTPTAATVFQLQSADALAGTGNVWNLGGVKNYVITVPNFDVLTGAFPRSQEYLNIIQTNAGTWDAEVWGTPLK